MDCGGAAMDNLLHAGPCAGFFVGAPGMAFLLGGESPLLARQGEELAKGKGFAGDCESEGSRRQSAGLTNRKRI